jgi:hypothetical protein
VVLMVLAVLVYLNKLRLQLEYHGDRGGVLMTHPPTLLLFFLHAGGFTPPFRHQNSTGGSLFDIAQICSC